MTGVPEAVIFCAQGQNKGQKCDGVLEWLIYVAEMRKILYYWGRMNYGSTWE